MHLMMCDYAKFDTGVFFQFFQLKNKFLLSVYKSNDGWLISWPLLYAVMFWEPNKSKGLYFLCFDEVGTLPARVHTDR